MTNWKHAAISADGTHHVCNGIPIYRVRFDEVLKFHEPGLAPARRGTEAWHIRPDGDAAYMRRFRQTFGFYELRAAVEDETGWGHIGPNGDLVYPADFSWCGNFQQGRCAVRDQDGLFAHIDINGNRVGAARHLYAGDYRDGVAVVRCEADGLCTHVGLDGRETHGARFLDLDVFHKGLARARDAAGWFHVDTAGRAAYAGRFENVEPFYNGLALAWNWTGEIVRLDRNGTIRHRVLPGASRLFAPRFKLLVLGNLGAGKSTVAGGLSDRFGWQSVSIDRCRQAHSDGTAAGELRAWAVFVSLGASPGPRIMECTGIGPHIPLLRLALRESQDRVGVLWVRTPVADCVARSRSRSDAVPYPSFGVAQDQVAIDLEPRLAEAMQPGGVWGAERLAWVDGTEHPTTAVNSAVRTVSAWIEG